MALYVGILCHAWYLFLGGVLREMSRGCTEGMGAGLGVRSAFHPFGSSNERVVVMVVCESRKVKTFQLSLE